MNTKMTWSLPCMVLLFSVMQIEAKKLKKKKHSSLYSSQTLQSQASGVHQVVQEQFAQLRQQVGLATSQAEKNSIRYVTGGQGTQQQFNAVRSQLNTLLSKPVLSAGDIQEINQKIDELARLNPARWPRPENYREVLNKKIAGGAPVAPAPMAPPVVKPVVAPPMGRVSGHDEIQNTFIELRQQVLGLATSPELKNSRRRVMGVQGTQDQFNQVRSQLNRSLSKPILSADDVKAINQKINELENLHPARWPGPEDYREILEAKLP